VSSILVLQFIWHPAWLPICRLGRSHCCRSIGRSGRRTTKSAGDGAISVGHGRHSRVVRLPVDHGGEIAVELDRRRVVELLLLQLHVERHVLRKLGGHQDPCVPLALDHQFRQSELAQPVEVRHRLRRQGQAVSGCQLRDQLAVLLPVPDLRAQAPVDFGDGGFELLLVRDQQLADTRQRHAGVGERTDPDQLDDGVGVVPPVAGVVAFRLRQETLGVVVPHRTYGDSGVRRQLADREPVRHGASLYLTGTRRNSRRDQR
jgi:hypothetical protein